LPLEEQAITSLPDFFTVNLGRDEHDFLLIGCDGVFDRFSNAELAEFIYAEIDQQYSEYLESIEQSTQGKSLQSERDSENVPSISKLGFQF